MPRHAPGWWTRREALEAYQRATNSHLAEADLKFYWLLAMFRNIGAVAQLIVLYEREAMPNTNDLDMPGSVESMLDHAVGLVDRPLDW